MHFILLPVNAPTGCATSACQLRHHRSHRLWRPSDYSPLQGIPCQASNSEQQQAVQGVEPQPPTTVLPASIKNGQQLDKLLKELADLREQQRLMGLEDDGEIEEDVEGEEGKDWVWWRAEHAAIPVTTNNSTPSKDNNKGSNTESSQQQQHEGQANSAPIQKVSSKPESTSQPPRMMQAKRRVRPDSKLSSNSGPSMKH